jgi:uncharacterized phiE125 gp8 family phage protein
MGLTRTVDPASLAVALADAKKQCEVADSDTSHDNHITRLIRAATSDVERHTRRALVTQTWRLSLREFPLYSHVNKSRVYLPRPPLQSITSIQYVDDNGTTQTLNSSLYQVTADSKPGYVEPAFGESWPTLRPETVEAISITYLAGYGNAAANVPAEFQNVIFELVAFRFMNRGDVQQDIPKHIRWSLDSLKCGAKYDYYGIKG